MSSEPQLHSEPHSEREILTLTPAPVEVGQRIDKMIPGHTYLSRTQTQELIKNEEITVNNAPTKASYKLEAGDEVRIILPPIVAAHDPQPEAIPLDILYEDDDIAIINKPAGMVVHPAEGAEDGTLVNALLARWGDLPADEEDPNIAGIVHRLDKDTSGLILVALHEEARSHLQAQFKDRTVEKHYLALTEKTPTNDQGHINAPIGRDPHQRKRMAVVRGGREATTDFIVREVLGEYALLDVHPRTGRTHQIRVHLAFIGCPVVGDMVYGYRKKRIALNRFFLHAYRLSFDHPRTGERLNFEAPLPDDLQKILETLRA